MKAVIVILGILSVALGVGLLVRHNSAVKLQKENDDHVQELVNYSNRLEETKTKVDELVKVNSTLETNLTVRSQDLASRSNDLVKTAAELAKTQKEAQAAAEAAKAEMAKRDTRITELETQKTVLDQQANDLKSAIGNLEKSIGDTEKKLAASEGDREFLLKELKRLQVEKAELERQFNDLAVLRTQVAKLKEELSISRRLEWIRMGIYGLQAQKGAEKLMATPAIPSPASNFNLQVELKQDGGAIIVPAKTNAAEKAAAPK
jgi:chromosome segregation ATPase